MPSQPKRFWWTRVSRCKPPLPDEWRTVTARIICRDETLARRVEHEIGMLIEHLALIVEQEDHLGIYAMGEPTEPEPHSDEAFIIKKRFGTGAPMSRAQIAQELGCTTQRVLWLERRGLARATATYLRQLG